LIFFFILFRLPALKSLMSFFGKGGRSGGKWVVVFVRNQKSKINFKKQYFLSMIRSTQHHKNKNAINHRQKKIVATLFFYAKNIIIIIIQFYPRKITEMLSIF
jgi:hypothetical protein